MLFRSNSLEGDREKCLAAGMDDYLSKPVRPADLIGALSRFAGTVSYAPAPLPEPAAKGVIDGAMLAGYREMDGPGGENLLDSLIATFLENTPAVLAAAQAALALQAASELERAAHTLKGSCSNFGAEAMRLACQRLEEAARAGALAQAPAMLAAVEREFSFVRLALERERSLCPA